ncbi:MAG: carbohydrate kinase [Verrucomicrobia bacterium]|nr:carbohydrate kinase [Verrucomicrobiota bacterium]
MNEPVLGIGEVLWDVLPAGRQLGGAPANFAHHANALGARALPVSAVGDDAWGREAGERLQSAGLDTRLLAVDSAHPTGTAEVGLDAEGKPAFSIRRGVAWDFLGSPSHRAPASVENAMEETSAVCFGSLAQRSAPSAETIQRWLSLTRPDCLRVFDINLRFPDVDTARIRQSLSRTTLLKLNDEELVWLGPALGWVSREDEVMRELFRAFPIQGVVLTRGEKGARLITRERVVEAPMIPVERIEDTVGAGDAFAAVVTVGWLRGWSLETMAVIASRAAAFVCGQRGATPDMTDFYRGLKLEL